MDGVVRGIVAVTALTMALEVGALEWRGIGPFGGGPAAALAAGPADSGTSPPSTTAYDCDGDGADGDEADEGFDCLVATVADYALDKRVILGALVGVSLAVILTGALIAFAPEGVIAAAILGTAIDPVVTGFGVSLLQSQLYGAAMMAIGAIEGGVSLGFLLNPDISGSRAAAAENSAVPLPQRLSLRLPGAAPTTARCHGPKAGRCRAFLRALRTYVDRSLDTAAVVYSMGRATREFELSGERHQPYAQAYSSGTAKLLALRLVSALGAQERAGKAFAALLARRHADIRLGRRATAAVLRRLLTLQHMPASALAQLHALSLRPQDLKRLLRKGVGDHLAGGFSLRAVLARHIDTAPLMKLYRSITIPEVIAIISQLRSPGTDKQVSLEAATTLGVDLGNAQRACTASQREAPMQAFAAHLGTGVVAPYRELLATAVDPLMHPPANPANKPPRADFATSPENPRIASSGGSVAVHFVNKATDPLDGGHVGCWIWAFGDQGSGEANTSFDPEPSHTYAAPGTYTVSLEVRDDDGFAADVVTRRLTVAGP